MSTPDTPGERSVAGTSNPASAWLDRRLAPLTELVAGLGIVLDPHAVVDPATLAAHAVVADSWALRVAYERQARRRPPSSGPFVLVVTRGLATRPLPWDIERSGAVVLVVRFPGPADVRAALAGLEGDEAERAITAVEAASDPAATLLAVVAGVTQPVAPPMTRVDQFRLAARLATRLAPTEPLLALARRHLDDPILVGLLRRPPDCSQLQSAWERFATEADRSWAETFATCQPELSQLFAAGLLRPVVPVGELPVWAAIGTRALAAEERAEAMLAARPCPFPPTDVAGWSRLAVWWGELRRLVAGGDPDLAERAWACWAEIDAGFGPWLTQNYGAVLSSSAPWPSAVHQVGHYLARRLREGAAQRVLLIVLDGLGHAQWAYLRENAGLTVAEPGCTFALLPTLTSVSRQAIFAGELPVCFPDTLWTTRAEQRRWRTFWAGEGLADVNAVHYDRVGGHFPQDRIDFGVARAVGVVVNAVDDFMHGSELLGDAQLFANLGAWVANGFLQDLVGRAHGAGFEVWITADHGNLEGLPGGRRSEGLAIEAAGKRCLRYANPALRDASTAAGIPWDDIPGLPPSAGSMRFAPARLAYTSQALSVSHGGLSLDEVIVPLVRLAP
ncbi:MAG: BREX-3 system phosphatase PglZ [Acidimicrobiales bacterium]